MPRKSNAPEPAARRLPQQRHQVIEISIGPCETPLILMCRRAMRFECRLSDAHSVFLFPVMLLFGPFSFLLLFFFFLCFAWLRPSGELSIQAACRWRTHAITKAVTEEEAARPKTAETQGLAAGRECLSIGD